jgi:hypothetical protein
MKKNAILTALSILLTMTVSATTVNYTADNTSIFSNPERGFTEELGGETMLTDNNNHVIQPEADWFFSNSRNSYASLLVAIYYLGNYRTKALSDKILQGFDEDMQILRNKGYKCVLRFAYDWNSCNDATKAQILSHISQLKPHLEANADVIYVIETGFVGQWGEWYYTKNFGNYCDDDDDPTQHVDDNRRAVITAMLEACPSDRFLLVRYPMIKTDYLGDNAALTSTQAYQNTARARLGHHNDAFLNDYGDNGTYASDNKSDDPAVRQYIADETLYVPNGGETNVESNSRAQKMYKQAEAQMSTYHWSFCGESYAEQMTDRWDTSGVKDNLNRKMGYRYQLVTATFPASANAGGTASIHMQIKNVGYAPIYNERHAYIVLKNGNNTYSIQLQSDPRRWLPNDAVTTIDEQITIPSNVPAGTYQMYLHMPDKYASLASNPRYAVRFANTGVWDANTGMNNLNASIVISEGVTPPPTPGTDAVILPATLNKANVSTTSDDTWWASDADYYDFGSDDAENTGRTIDWKVYLKYPGQYIVSAVIGFPGDDNADGFTPQLELLKGTTAISTYAGEYTWAVSDATYTAKWDLSAVAVNEYVLRAKNTAEWEQPKLKSLTLTYDGELPTGIEETRVGSSVTKILRNGQLIIIRDNKEYNALGAHL